MKIETAYIYHRIVNRLARTEEISLEEATEIVDRFEAWLIDSVEAFDQINITQLTNAIIEMHYDEVNN